MRSFVVIGVLLPIVLTLCEIVERVRYDNYQVFKVLFENYSQKENLFKLININGSIQVWHEIQSECTVMVAPNALPEFKGHLKLVNASAHLVVKNVQDLIDKEQNGDNRSDAKFNWSRYNSLHEIYVWLDEILAAYPNTSQGFDVGQSYEGRTIRGIRISFKNGNPGVFIESNIHAREWITSATATWLINELLTSKDEFVRDLAENHDWYIIPVLNVDGFVFSHEKDRLWRKTRKPSVISNCFGVDPNRNFDSHWMENGGASANPCDETYAGPQPFSEPEIKALADLVASIKDKVNILLAFHSYSQLLLSPYGHTKEEVPDNFDDLMQIAGAYSKAVGNLPYGTVYRYGSSAEILYPASGSTIDWAYNKQDIKITYTIEFRDTGNFGFVLPAAFIKANAEETLIGINALLLESKKLGYLNAKYK